MLTNPWPKNIFLRTLAAIWSSLTMIPTLIIVGILSASKQLSNRRWKDGAWEFIIVQNSWLFKKTTKYNGFSIGWCIIYNEDSFNNLVTRTHERIHLLQQLKLSVFQWILYGLFYVAIYLGTNLDTYSANPFESDARIQAGQNVGELNR